MKEKLYCPFCGVALERRNHEGRIRPYCIRCDTPIYENPVPATAVVVADPASGILLVRRSVEPKKGEWCLPGGFIELAEAPDRGALRELTEETGITGTIDVLLGVETNNSDTYGTVLIVGYLVTRYTGDPIPGDDAEDVAFFTVENMPSIAFNSHAAFIRRAMDRLRGATC
ncbi:MAG: NUDIX hydrolase [Thermodesulfobacteriota bacterium]